MTESGFREKLLERAAAAAVALTTAHVVQLEAYFVLLKRWNARINLTALPLDEPGDHTLDRLFIEPLAAARYVCDAPLMWIDVGSGGGSPAIPLKLMRPAARLTMVESKGRKAAFLREAVRALELRETDVQSVRFEELPNAPGSVDLITIRAVRRDNELLNGCRNLLRLGGDTLIFRASAEASSVYRSDFAKRPTVQLAASSARLEILTAV